LARRWRAQSSQSSQPSRRSQRWALMDHGPCGDDAWSLSPCCAAAGLRTTATRPSSTHLRLPLLLRHSSFTASASQPLLLLCSPALSARNRVQCQRSLSSPPTHITSFISHTSYLVFLLLYPHLPLTPSIHLFPLLSLPSCLSLSHHNNSFILSILTTTTTTGVLLATRTYSGPS
jgi:hypothetical protein